MNNTTVSSLTAASDATAKPLADQLYRSGNFDAVATLLDRIDDYARRGEDDPALPGIVASVMSFNAAVNTRPDAAWSKLVAAGCAQ